MKTKHESTYIAYKTLIFKPKPQVLLVHNFV